MSKKSRVSLEETKPKVILRLSKEEAASLHEFLDSCSEGVLDKLKGLSSDLCAAADEGLLSE